MKKIIHDSRSLAIYMLTVLFLAIPHTSSADLSYEIKTKITPTSFEELLVALLNVFIVIAVPIIILFIIYAGFLYVTAKGNVEQTQQATRTLTYAIVGGIIIIGALTIAEIIKNVVAAFTTP